MVQVDLDQVLRLLSGATIEPMHWPSTSTHKPTPIKKACDHFCSPDKAQVLCFQYLTKCLTFTKVVNIVDIS